MSRIAAFRRTAARIARTAVIGTLGTAVLGAAALASTGAAQAATITSQLSMTAGTSAYAWYQDNATGVSETTYTVPSYTTRPIFLGLQLRSTKADTGYRTRVSIAADGSMRAGLSRVVAGKETVLVTAPLNIWVSGGQDLHIEGSVTGTDVVSVKVRVWMGTSAKPTGWNLTTTDDTASRITSGTIVRTWGYQAPEAPKPATVDYTFEMPTPPSTGTTTTDPHGTDSGSSVTGGTPTAPVKPSASNTGPTTTNLARYEGNITVTRPGTVLENLDIYGFVTIKAANVIIRNSIIRGGSVTYNTGLITNYGYDNLLVEDTLLQRDVKSVWVDGIKGWDYTLNRVHIVGGVDTAKIQGDNVTIKNSLLESTDYFASDPNQGGGATHNDGIQILNGTNLVITGNTIRDITNFPIMNGAEQGNVNATISGNWLDGGHCTVKISNKAAWTQNTTLTNNHFGPNRIVAKCPVQAYTTATVTASGNDYELTGLPVSILWSNA